MTYVKICEWRCGVIYIRDMKDSVHKWNQTPGMVDITCFMHIFGAVTQGSARLEVSNVQISFVAAHVPVLGVNANL
jgi:hypothetical protein